MKKKIREFLINAGYAIEHRLKLLCGKPSPMKRFIIVVVISCTLSIAFLYTLVSSIYNIGKHDTEQIMNIEHINRLELKNSSDSINLKKQQNHEYEYE
jgi:hypothetical protein